MVVVHHRKLCVALPVDRHMSCAHPACYRNVFVGENRGCGGQRGHLAQGLQSGVSICNGGCAVLEIAQRDTDASSHWCSHQYHTCNPHSLSTVEIEQPFPWPYIFFLVLCFHDAVQWRYDTWLHCHQQAGTHQFHLGADAAWGDECFVYDSDDELLPGDPQRDRGSGCH